MVDLIIWSIMGLIVFSAIAYSKIAKNKKYIERLKNMNFQQRQLELMKIQTQINSKKTSHILHLLLCVFTIGFWVIPWFMISINNRAYRKELENMMTQVTDVEVVNTQLAA